MGEALLLNVIQFTFIHLADFDRYLRNKFGFKLKMGNPTFDEESINLFGVRYRCKNEQVRTSHKIPCNDFQKLAPLGPHEGYFTFRHILYSSLKAND